MSNLDKEAVAASDRDLILEVYRIVGRETANHLCIDHIDNSLLAAAACHRRAAVREAENDWIDWIEVLLRWIDHLAKSHEKHSDDCDLCADVGNVRALVVRWRESNG